MSILPPSLTGKVSPGGARSDEPVSTENMSAENANGENQPLYADRVRVYPQRIRGAFRRFKWAVLVGLVGLYYLAPWLRWDRGPNAPSQALLVDLPGRRAYFFGLEIWPQEVYYLTGLLILAAVGLFLVTSLFGRVWCGFACPQTAWTDLFMWVERFVEGDRNARMRLDRGPWTASRVARKAAKHGIWVVIAMLTGGAWVMYFTDAPTLVSDILNLHISGAVLFFIGLFTATTWLLAGIAREQVCTYMCPWPRFQAAMFDEDTLIVTYEGWRGEPRGKHKAGESWDGRGHCVDCRQCVNVCPTGIDIRDGSQLECIGCGLCIDACNIIMDKVDLPRGLIRLDTLSNQTARAKGGTAPFRVLRSRTLLYAGILAVVAALMAFGLATRATLDINLLRDRNPLFVTLSDGAIRNGYTLKVLNMARADRRFSLTVEGIVGASLAMTGGPADAERLMLGAEPDGVATYRVFVRAPRAALDGDSTPLRFVLTETVPDGERVLQDTVFRGPKR